MRKLIISILLAMPFIASASERGTNACFLIFSDSGIFCIGPQSQDLCSVEDPNTMWGEFYGEQCAQKEALRSGVQVFSGHLRVCEQARLDAMNEEERLEVTLASLPSKPKGKAKKLLREEKKLGKKLERLQKLYDRLGEAASGSDSSIPEIWGHQRQYQDLTTTKTISDFLVFLSDSLVVNKLLPFSDLPEEISCEMAKQAVQYVKCGTYVRTDNTLRVDYDDGSSKNFRFSSDGTLENAEFNHIRYSRGRSLSSYRGFEGYYGTFSDSGYGAPSSSDYIGLLADGSFFKNNYNQHLGYPPATNAHGTFSCKQYECSVTTPYLTLKDIVVAFGTNGDNPRAPEWIQSVKLTPSEMFYLGKDEPFDQ